MNTIDAEKLGHVVAEKMTGSDLDDALQQKIDRKTKPIGALGTIECLALQIGRIQQSLTPQLLKPHLLLFAADHGAVESGVSAYPKDVTWQMVENILSGGAASSVFARDRGVALTLVDAGVDHDFVQRPNWVHQFISSKIARGTANFVMASAMTAAQRDAAIAEGRAIIKKIHRDGCNIVMFGEMGIGNTSSAALLMHILSGVPLDDCTGRGAGLDDVGLARKRLVLHAALARCAPLPISAIDALAEFGGFEIAMLVGAMLEATAQKMVMLIDGFIVSAALLVASRINANVLQYCVFAHQSDEQGHRRLLELLGAKPLLLLGMRLGEGTGALVAYPLLQAAVCFINEMASFESAGVSTRVNTIAIANSDVTKAPSKL